MNFFLLYFFKKIFLLILFLNIKIIKILVFLKKLEYTRKHRRQIME